MATRTQIETTINDLLRILEEARSYAAVNTSRFTGGPAATGESVHEETFLDNLQSDFALHADLTRGVDRFRARLNNLLLSAPELLTPGLREYGKFIKAPETDPQQILTRLYDDFIENGQRVPTRGFTFGSPAADVGNTGNGNVNRLTVDENGLDLEAQTPDAKIVRCIRDEHSGADEHEEVFEIRGEDRARDVLVIEGSGGLRQIKALSARDSLQFIANPSFSQFSGNASAPTDITSWDFANTAQLANVAIETSTVYRGFRGDSTPRSLKVSGDIEMTQNFSVRRLQLNPRVPLYVQIAVHKGTATTGTLDLTIGITSIPNLSLSSLSAGWNIVRFKASDVLLAGGDERSWYKNFRGNAPFIGVETASMGSGEHIFIDDIVIAPYTPFDGAWYAIIGGATQFIVDDEFTFSDTATESIIGRWLWRAFRRYLPHATSTDITWSDPT